MPRPSISATNRRFRRTVPPAVWSTGAGFSVQWFSGTILTGLCGAALMGGAVFASLDGQTNFASAPEQVETALRGAISSIGDRLERSGQPTDRLPALSEPSVARQNPRAFRSRRACKIANWCACVPTCASPAIFPRPSATFPPTFPRTIRKNSSPISSPAPTRRRPRNRTPKFRS